MKSIQTKLILVITAIIIVVVAAFLITSTFRTNSILNDVSELGKSIAENTRGAMAVYLRYNPEDYGPISGFWYTIKLDDNSWQPSVPTDMSL